MRVQSRRTDVFPTTWEIPVGIGLTWAFASVLVLPFGQGLACLVVGEPFVWPRKRLSVSLLGLVEGEPGRGLPPDIVRQLPPTALVYACIIAAELMMAVLAVWGLSFWWRTVGPLAQFGVATRHEVADVLGRRALARSRDTIRPDLPPSSRWRLLP